MTLSAATIRRARSLQADYIAATSYRARQAVLNDHYDRAPKSDRVFLKLVDRIARLEWEAAYELPPPRFASR